ncbi:MAG: NADH-quinone oxidoreductase subunit C, partial [Candidatus Omnitrophica bacterium]|nr:NADH-quinone oxidoreductase subunit C [Candidatus Omnitrophota bacterium]
MKTLEEIKQNLETKLQDTQITLEGTSLVVPKERWLQIAKVLKEEPEYRFDYLSCLTGVD